MPSCERRTAFPTYEGAYAWLEGFTAPQSTKPPAPFEALR